MNGAGVTTVDLIRHGQAEGGARYRGTTDDPLSAAGWAEMRAALGARCDWDAVVSSPLRRCAEPAAEVATRCGLALAREAGLAEMHFGEWEGRPAADIFAEEWEAITRFWEDPARHTPPGAEPLAAFEARVRAAWGALLDTHAGRRVLVVAHAGTIRVIVRHVLGVPVERMFRIDVPYARVTRIRIDEARGVRQPRLLFHAAAL